MCGCRARGNMPRLLIFVILVSTTLAKKYGSYGRNTGYGTHSYPQSTGHSGHGTNNGLGWQTHNTQPATGTGSHSYPSSTGLSGNRQHQQPIQHTQHTQGAHYSTKNEVHHHYHYNPPTQITYASHTYPVYHGSPPVYVYNYVDSGSRFDTLLTGLALYNLGKMSASHHHHDDYNYRRNSGEVCKLGISKPNGDYEETRIDCQLMSSFIWEAQATQPHNEVSSKTVTNVMNVTTTSNGNVTTSVTVTNTTLVDAREVKGPSIKVTSDMKCFLMRMSRDTSVMKKTVDCDVLQMYARHLTKTSDRVLPLQSVIICSIIFSCLQPLYSLG